MPRYYKRVVCEGRTFLVFHDHKGYWAVESQEVVNGTYKGERKLLRNSLNEVIEAIINSVEIERLMTQEGLSRSEATMRVFFG